MAKECKRIACAAGTYTQISTGQANVSFMTYRIAGGRVAFGATQPSPATGDYNTVYPGEPWDIGGLSATDYLWYMPSGTAETLEIVRG